MTQTATDAVRNALDQVDCQRKRSRQVQYGLLAMTLLFWAAMILSKDDHQGLPFGLAAVIGSVFYAGMSATKASHDNTRVILKSIELLALDRQDGRGL